MSDLTPPRSLLLGTAGFARAAWSGDYYPDDIPADWRLEYYANDCDCMLLAADDRAALDPGEFAAWLAETPDDFRCLVELGADEAPGESELVAALAGSHSVLLVARSDRAFTALPQWPADGEDTWRDPVSGRCVVRWWLDDTDLRAWRRRVESLDTRTGMLVIDGPFGDPGRIAELRTLLELMGRA